MTLAQYACMSHAEMNIYGNGSKGGAPGDTCAVHSGATMADRTYLEYSLHTLARPPDEHMIALHDRFEDSHGHLLI